MPLNNPQVTPQSLRPRPRVLTNGSLIPNCKSVSVTSTNNFHGDTFSASFALDRTMQNGQVGSDAWWASQDTLPVDVQLGLVPPGGGESDANWTSMLTGKGDRISLNRQQAVATIDGRDLTALLRDTTSGAFEVNQTSSDIVTALANMVGLTPAVTQTTELVGRYFGSDHTISYTDRAHRAANMWDAIVELARYEGFDAFVQGNTLYFQPQTDSNSDSYLISETVDPTTRILVANVTGLLLQRRLDVAQGVKVTVRSWASRSAQTIEGMASTPGSGPLKQYNIVRPGLSQDQADNLAARYLAEITRHERTISGTLPGDMVLTPRVMLRLIGTGTAFDQSYYPETVERQVGGRGFTMSFTAKNVSPEVESGAG